MTSELDPRQRSGWHIAGWRAYLFAPLVLPIAIFLSLLPGKKTKDRSAADVAVFLKEFIDGTGGRWDWDDFESVSITNPLLEKIRLEAVMAGPPNADILRLKALLARVEALRGTGGNS
jgi:hypothetical protein